MRRRVLGLLLVGLMAAVAMAQDAPNSTSMPAVWRYAHPEATALVGIEWTRVLSSPVGQQIQAKVGETGFSGTPGIEFLDDIDRIFISTPGAEGGAAGEQPPAVVAVQGRFDLDKVRGLAAAKMGETAVYRSVEILEEGEDRENKEPMSMALVSEQTILVGDGASVRAAIDNHVLADAEQMMRPLFVRAMNLASANDVWVVSEASPSQFSPGSSEAAPFLEDVDSIEAGISLQEGLGLEMNLGTGSPEAAANLAGGLQFIVGMMLAEQAKNPGMPNLSEKLTVETDDRLVRMALRLDQAELESAFQVATSQAAETVVAESREPATPRWEEPAPETSKNRVITIIGMDEGPREIPFDR
ncbi:MAG: hypothetical protein GY953_15890 [bacterium]|nr:hypothetical protein [bacterium]